MAISRAGGAVAAALLAAAALMTGCGNPPTFPSDVVSDVRTDSAVMPDGTPPTDTPVVPDGTPPNDVQTPTDGGCRTDNDCSDNVFCNGVERCVSGSCQAATVEPCDDMRSCTNDSCNEDTDSCQHLPAPSRCSDGNACNGAERCEPTNAAADRVTGCMPPSATEIDCNDSNNCTLDSCDPVMGCSHAPRDLDGDGHVDRICTLDGTPGGPQGDDCDDTNPMTFPGAAEVCDDGSDNNCNGVADLSDLMGCTASNDTCATATRLPGAGTFMASTSGLTDDMALSCNTGTFADAVFEFTTTEMHDVTVSSTARGTTSAIALYRECDAASLRCNRATSTTTSPSLTARSLPAGTYRIVVETGATPAAFTLALTLDAATPIPGGDLCPADATSPVIDLSDGAPHTAALSNMDNEYQLQCRTTATGTSARDAVFRLVVTDPSDVVLEGTAAAGTTYLDLRTDPCGTGTSGSMSLQCVSGSGTTGARARVRNVQPGTYWVFAENSTTTTPNPDVTVRATITPPVAFIPNDRCPESDADPVEELNDGRAHMLRMTTLEDNYSFSCRGTTAITNVSNRDGMLRLTLPDVSDVTIRASSITGTNYVSLRNAACDEATSEMRCFSGDPSLFTFRRLPAGTYFVAVENSSTTNPDVFVTATLAAPTPVLPGDNCPADPADPVLELNTGMSQVVNLTRFDDNTNVSCSSTGRRDAVFRLTVDAESDVAINATTLGTGTTYVSLRDSCNPVGNELRCYSDSSATTYNRRNVPPGVYWVWVETSGSADADLLITAMLTPATNPRAAGDVCATAVPVTPDGGPTTITRSTLLTGSDVGTSCGSGTGTGGTYSDGVFQFTLTERRDVTVNVIRAAGTSGTVYWDVRANCNDRASMFGTCASGGTATTTRVVRNMMPGTYFIVAESLNSSTAITGYTATVTTATPSGGYTVSQPTGIPFVDACALPGAVTGLPNLDDAVLAVPNASVGFPIRYFNTDITSNLTISSNGWLGMLATTSVAHTSYIGDTATPNNLIAGYWRDLDTRAGVCYATTGTAGSRQFIVQWQNATHHTSTDQSLTFQIIVHEQATAGTNNVIDVVYQTMTGADTVAMTRTGVENSDASIFTAFPGPYAPVSATEPRVVRFTYTP